MPTRLACRSRSPILLAHFFVMSDTLVSPALSPVSPSALLFAPEGSSSAEAHRGATSPQGVQVCRNRARRVAERLRTRVVPGGHSAYLPAPTNAMSSLTLIRLARLPCSLARLSRPSGLFVLPMCFVRPSHYLSYTSRCPSRAFIFPIRWPRRLSLTCLPCP